MISKLLKRAILHTHWLLVAILLASSVVFSGAQSAPTQSSPNASKPASAAANQPAPTGQSAKPTTAVAPAQPNAPAGRPAPAWQGTQLNLLSRRAEIYYEGVWGVGELHVKVAESGSLIRFNYRVLDPEKAAALNDKKAEPALFDAQAGVKLVVPQMDKVGKLRQSSTPKTGMTYWMAFSNPTRVVKRGHRVDVVIGSFRANSLIVE
jgi:hypothetical protein